MSGYPLRDQQKIITGLPCSHLTVVQQWLGKLHHSRVQGFITRNRNGMNSHNWLATWNVDFNGKQHHCLPHTKSQREFPEIQLLPHSFSVQLTIVLSCTYHASVTIYSSHRVPLLSFPLFHIIPMSPVLYFFFFFSHITSPEQLQSSVSFDQHATRHV